MPYGYLAHAHVGSSRPRSQTWTCSCSWTTLRGTVACSCESCSTTLPTNSPSTPSHGHSRSTSTPLSGWLSAVRANPSSSPRWTATRSSWAATGEPTFERVPRGRTTAAGGGRGGRRAGSLHSAERCLLRDAVRGESGAQRERLLGQDPQGNVARVSQRVR